MYGQTSGNLAALACNCDNEGRDSSTGKVILIPACEGVTQTTFAAADGYPDITHTEFVAHVLVVSRYR